ncbi:hypothetical protein [Chroococcidiopsis sp. TS-821]|uniref:hypothetical protein n=1 Tax=Chroococcidiopsis sp. TS-821 TaxID=1378066 RepID=UPI001FED5BC9|nr:hypothetical protein [Chroococcidiopsis sp. TS-821]
MATIHARSLRGPVNKPIRTIPSSSAEVMVAITISDPAQGALNTPFTNSFSCGTLMLYLYVIRGN